jgi:chromosome partitioning protein
MSITIAVVNQKGGVGKTTSAVNLTAALADSGIKTLLCDFDPQANATSGLGVEKRKIKKSVYDVIIDGAPVEEVIVHTKFGDVLPSGADLAGAAVELLSLPEPNFRLANALKAVKDQYDVILIDCPPSLELLTINALAAADSILIPVEASPWGLFGLANMFEFVEQAKNIAPRLEILGIAVTKADERKKYFKQTMETLQEMENARLFENYIRVDSAVEWSQDNSKPVVVFKKSSRSAVEYTKLAKEIMDYANRKERN